MEFIRDSNLKRNRINAFNDDDVVAPKAKIQKLQDEIEQDCLGGLGYETFFFSYMEMLEEWFLFTYFIM